MAHQNQNKLFKAKDLVSQFGAFDGKKFLLPQPGMLHAISWDVGLPIPANSAIANLYDQSILILSIDVKVLAKAITDMRQKDIDLGLNWKIPLYKDSIEVHHNLEHGLVVDNNWTGLIFWVESKALANTQ